MEACPVYFEVNLDVSHYNFRQIKHSQSKHLRTITKESGTHTSECAVSLAICLLMFQILADWAEKGLTWQAFESMRTSHHPLCIVRAGS